MQYWSGSSSKHRLLVHLVWIPKYRRRVLVGKVANRLQDLIKQGCEMNDWKIHELSIQKDHVHLLLQFHPRESIAKVVQILKGGTSRTIRIEFPELEEWLWGNSLWADGYFAETVGQQNAAAIAEYIRTQDKHDT